MSEFLLRFASDERGATAIEYGLIGASICVLAIAGFTAFGDAGRAMFDEIATKFSAAVT